MDIFVDNDRLREVLSKTVKREREASNLTQADVARLVGHTRAMQSAIEKGITIPSTIKLFRTATILGISLDALMDEVLAGRNERTE